MLFHGDRKWRLFSLAALVAVCGEASTSSEPVTRLAPPKASPNQMESTSSESHPRSFEGIQVDSVAGVVHLRLDQVPVSRFCAYLGVVHGISALPGRGMEDVLNGSMDASDLEKASDLLLRKNGLRPSWIGDILVILPVGGIRPGGVSPSGSTNEGPSMEISTGATDPVLYGAASQPANQNSSQASEPASQVFSGDAQSSANPAGAIPDATMATPENATPVPPTFVSQPDYSAQQFSNSPSPEIVAPGNPNPGSQPGYSVFPSQMMPSAPSDNSSAVTPQQVSPGQGLDPASSGNPDSNNAPPADPQNPPSSLPPEPGAVAPQSNTTEAPAFGPAMQGDQGPTP